MYFLWSINIDNTKTRVLLTSLKEVYVKFPLGDNLLSNLDTPLIILWFSETTT